MNTNKPAKPEQKTSAKTATPNKGANVKTEEFVIVRPMLWLGLAAIAVYIISLSFGYTDLDDTIFIRDFHLYNEDVHNLITSFQRGLFDAVKDPYYRPLFSDSIILNYQLSETGIASYHAVNIFLHMIAVILLYKLFLKLGVKKLAAFILALVFAAHPVLSQAVAWIPGRNDTLLAIFTFSFLLFAIDYANEGKLRYLGISASFLLLAMFTKETAVFAPPAAFILIVFVLHKNKPDRRNFLLYAKMAGCYLVWFVARAMATTAPTCIVSGGWAEPDNAQAACADTIPG